MTTSSGPAVENGGLSSERCNAYIDTIQQALDNSLSTTGNLSPDAPVVEALGQLQKCVEGVAELRDLVAPLHAMISELEAVGGTFNAEDTLLVQEAVVAVTLGVDSIANDAPTPELIEDVTARIALAAEQIGEKRLPGVDDGLLDTFIEEATIRLQQLYELFQRWRSAPQSTGRRIDSICRSLHNLKGAANSVGLDSFATLVHQFEAAVLQFESIEPGEIEHFFSVSVECLEVLLDDVDGLRAGESSGDHPQLLGALARWAGEQAETRQPVSLAANTRDGLPPAQPTNGPAAAQLRSMRQACVAASNKLVESRLALRRASEQARELNVSHARLMNLAGEHLASIGRGTTRVVQESAGLHASLSQSLTDLAQSLQLQAQQFDLALQEFDRVNLVSLDGLEQRLRSVAEQSAQALGKSIALTFTADQPEMSADLLAAISHPLEQLLRNAIVHGAEPRARRSEQGKSPATSVTIQIEQDPSRVRISVADDGQGVDFDRLGSVVAKKFALADRDRLDPDRLLSYVACRGVSTAVEPAVISGRGIGLDAVLAAVLELGGGMRATTGEAVGTRFELDLPRHDHWRNLITVRAADTLFAVPQAEAPAEAEAEVSRRVVLAELLGLASLSQSPLPESQITLQARGEKVLLVVQDVVGSVAKMQIHSGGLLMQQTPGFIGVAIGQADVPLPVLDIDYWLDRSRVEVVNKPARPTVLVVEDSSTMRGLIARALSTVHCECLFAHDAVEASALLADHQPAVVLLDIKLPRGDGTAVARDIRARGGGYSRIPIVFTTSIPRHVVADLLVEVEPAGYLEKPYTGDEVARLVAGLLSQALPSAV